MYDCLSLYEFDTYHRAVHNLIGLRGCFDSSTHGRVHPYPAWNAGVVSAGSDDSRKVILGRTPDFALGVVLSRISLSDHPQPQSTAVQRSLPPTLPPATFNLTNS